MPDEIRDLFDVTVNIATANGRFFVGAAVGGKEPHIRECATFAEAHLFVAEALEQLATAMRAQAALH